MAETGPRSLDPTPSFSALYAFGDSLSDAGNVYALTLHTLPAAPYVNGHFTNGPVWVQDLAASLGLPALKASLLGGTDFAYGDAETGTETLHSQTVLDLPSQFLQFEIAHPHPSPNALYTVSIGANDVFDAISSYSADPAAAMTDITQAVGNEIRFISALAVDGGRNFDIMNVPDLGKTPAAIAEGPLAPPLASALSSLYNLDLTAALSSLTVKDHLNLHVVNAYGLLDQAVADPAAFGLTNVTEPVWTGTYDNPASGVLNATGAAQNGFLFFDQLHPTATGHLFLAAAARASLGV